MSVSPPACRGAVAWLSSRTRSSLAGTDTVPKGLGAQGQCKQGIISPQNLIQVQEAYQHFSTALRSVLVKRLSEMKSAWTMQLSLRLCGTPKHCLPALLHIRSEDFSFHPKPQPNTHLNFVTQQCTVSFKTPAPYFGPKYALFTFFEFFLILVWKGAFWFFLCTSMHAQ